MAFLLRHQRTRNIALQVIFVVTLLAGLAALIITGKTNLDAQGITSGFGFLDRSTGWRISFSMLEYGTSSTYAQALLVGATNSLLVAAISLLGASILGLCVGVMRTSGNPMAELLGTGYVEIFRNIPLLLQLFFWYAVFLSLPSPKVAELHFGHLALTGRGFYVTGLNIHGGAVLASTFAFWAAVAVGVWLSSAKRFAAVMPRKIAWARRGVLVAGLGVALLILVAGRIPQTPWLNVPHLKGLNYVDGVRVPPELAAMLVTISIYGGAYLAEILRSGFNALPKGQTEAGYVLGLSTWQIFSRIRLPLAIRVVMPTLINQYVWLTKATTIGIAIGFPDYFMVVSTSINQSGQTIELMLLLMGGFLAVNYSLSWGMNRVNDAIRLKGTQLRT